MQHQSASENEATELRSVVSQLKGRVLEQSTLHQESASRFESRCSAVEGQLSGLCNKIDGLEMGNHPQSHNRSSGKLVVVMEDTVQAGLHESSDPLNSSLILEQGCQESCVSDTPNTGEMSETSFFHPESISLSTKLIAFSSDSRLVSGRGRSEPGW